jgi:hypothetical protein
MSHGGAVGDGCVPGVGAEAAARGFEDRRLEAVLDGEQRLAVAKRARGAVQARGTLEVLPIRRDCGRPVRPSVTKDTTPHVAPGQPTWPVDPQPIEAVAPTPAAVPSDDGIDWATIAIGIAGSLLAIGAIALVTYRRNSHRLRTTV